MEKRLKQFSIGGLYNLEHFEKVAIDERTEKNKFESDKKELRRLQKKVASLEQKKSELEKRLHIAKNDLSENKTANSDDLKDGVTELIRLKEVVKFHRLTGISVESVAEDGKIVLRFEGTNEGSYFKSYFIEILQDWNQQVFRHTLPSFIPVKEIASCSDLQTFIFKIRKYLFAFTARQSEVASLKSDCSAVLKGEVVCSFALDYIKMVTMPFEDTFPIKVVLVYDNLMDILPTAVFMTVLKSDEEEFAEPSEQLIEQWVEMYKSYPITKALKKIISMELQSEETSDFSSEL